MTYVDVYGTVIDADQVEQAFRTTLQTWLPSALANKEHQRGLAARTLPLPRSWPLVSDFDLQVAEQLPAIVTASTGTSNIEHDRGNYRVTWRLEVAIAIAGKDEQEARMLAAVYLAAVRSALVQNRTLDDFAENTRWVGPDDHAVAPAADGGQRAIYGTAFEVTVRDVVNDRLGPSEPPEDPYEPPDSLPSPLTAHIDVTYLEGD